MRTGYSAGQITCIVCGSTEHIFVTEARSGLKMLRCKRCSLIFAVPLWTAEHAAEAFSQQDGWPEGISGGDSDRDESMRYVASEIVGQQPSGGHLLDIGCANGAFFDMMRQTSKLWQFSGVEPDPKWQHFDYQDAKVCLHPLPECQFSEQTFDVVTILDAFWYIPEPGRYLTDVTRLIKPGGLLVIDLPGQGYLRLRGIIGGMLGLKRTRTFSAYPFYFSDQAIRHLLQRADLTVTGILADGGARQQKIWARQIMTGYLSLVRGMANISTRAYMFAPKAIYFAQRMEN